MDKRALARWSVLSIALATTIVASIYPADEPPSDVAPVESHPPALRRTVSSLVSEASRATSPDWLANEADPFAPRAWQPPSPAAEAPRTVRAVDAGPEAPPPPPPLPYAFVGQMSDGESKLVYLSRGEQLLIASAGEVLESTYKVVLIDKSHIEFETIASGLRQSLAIPAQDR